MRIVFSGVVLFARGGSCRCLDRQPSAALEVARASLPFALNAASSEPRSSLGHARPGLRCQRRAPRGSRSATVVRPGAHHPLDARQCALPVHGDPSGEAHVSVDHRRRARPRGARHRRRREYCSRHGWCRSYSGSEYEDAVPVVQVMLLGIPFVYATGPLLVIAYTHRRERRCSGRSSRFPSSARLPSSPGKLGVAQCSLARASSSDSRSSSSPSPP